MSPCLMYRQTGNLCLSVVWNFSSGVKFDREPGLSVSQPAVHSAPELGTNMFGKFLVPAVAYAVTRIPTLRFAGEVWKWVQVTADAE